MNGRVYDQWLGRFVSADPYVPEPLSTQAWNRYSYLYNDPLNAIDPNGFWPGDIVWQSPCADTRLCLVPFPGQFYDGVYPDFVFNSRNSRNSDFDSSSGSHRALGTETPATSDATWSGVGIALGKGLEAAAKQEYLRNLESQRLTNLEAFSLLALTIVEGPFAQLQARGLMYQSGAVLNGTAAAMSSAARGTGRLGGIITSTTNSAGGTVVTAAGDVVGSDFAGAVNSGMLRGGPVNVLSGAHGEASGLIRAERAFFEADRAAYGGLEGVNVFDITRMTPGEISGLLRGPGTTIGAFCESGACLAPFQ